MKNTLYTFLVLIALLCAGATQSRAEVTSNPGDEASQDTEVSTLVLEVVVSNASSDADQDGFVVISNTSADADQDGAAGINSDSSSDLAQDGAAGINSNPSSDLDQDGPSGIVSNPGTDLDQDGPVVVPPVVIDNGGSNGGSTGGSNRSSRIVPTVLGVATTSCPLITDYLKLGGSNNPVQVTNLQIFLKNSEKFDVDINGIFDTKTEAAVKAFQIKYMTSVLGPWGATRATGFVFITTQKKINELACAQPIVLSAQDRATIDAYNARTSSGSSVTEQVGTGTSETVDTISIDTVDTDDNTAAAANASILGRFWNFIKNLFR